MWPAAHQSKTRNSIDAMKVGVLLSCHLDPSIEYPSLIAGLQKNPASEPPIKGAIQEKNAVIIFFAEIYNGIFFWRQL